MVDAAQISGIDPWLAERLVQNWAFILLMRIVPFFRIHVGQSSSTSRERTTSAPKRPRLPPLPRRAFSFYIRCDAKKEAAESLADDSPTGDNSGKQNVPAGDPSPDRKHVTTRAEPGAVPP